MKIYVLEYKWTTSRSRDTYGYNICTLLVNGDKVTSCRGGGYDMQGTVLGKWLEQTFPDRIRRIRKNKYPVQSLFVRAEKPSRYCPGPSCRGRIAAELVYRNPDNEKEAACPVCGTYTRPNPNDGDLVEQPPAFYGLQFYAYDKEGKWVSSTTTPDRRHRVPSLDGGCGANEMRRIGQAIGLTFKHANEQVEVVTDRRAK